MSVSGCVFWACENICGHQFLLTNTFNNGQLWKFRFKFYEVCLHFLRFCWIIRIFLFFFRITYNWRHIFIISNLGIRTNNETEFLVYACRWCQARYSQTWQVAVGRHTYTYKEEVPLYVTIITEPLMVLPDVQSPVAVVIYTSPSYTRHLAATPTQYSYFC